MRLLRKPGWIALLLLSSVVGASTRVLPRALVLNNAAPADYIVVLDGHDDNYYTGLSLLRKGFGRQMFVCLDIPDVSLQGEELRKDREFIQQTAGRFAENIHLCHNEDEDIVGEIDSQLAQNAVQKVLIVTPEAQSRAEYITARRRLPQYTWSVRPSSDSSFDVHWWRRRLWTKTFLSSVVELGTALQTRTSGPQSVQRSAK